MNARTKRLLQELPADDAAFVALSMKCGACLVVLILILVAANFDPADEAAFYPARATESSNLALAPAGVVAARPVGADARSPDERSRSAAHSKRVPVPAR